MTTKRDRCRTQAQLGERDRIRIRSRMQSDRLRLLLLLLLLQHGKRTSFVIVLLTKSELKVRGPFWPARLDTSQSRRQRQRLPHSVCMCVYVCLGLGNPS